MQIVVLATDAQWNELAVETAGVQWIRAASPFTFSTYNNADVFFILSDTTDTNFAATEKPVFVNSVTTTLQQLAATNNTLRINGWCTFLQRPLWEIAGIITPQATAVLQQLNKQFICCNDEPGFIADKAIAMIINEAFFALGDDVSGKAEIDTAMKLGTNYPYGPFEWAEKIGLKNIYTLLATLSETDKRYTPAPALTQQATQQ
jgi:3-hydroxybutyryl-CoA dehydrogenase